MADITVYTEDGKTATFPAGTSRQVVLDTMQRVAPGQKLTFLGEPAAAAPPGAAAGSAATGAGKGNPGALADSFMARALRGLTVNRLDPAAEMLARAASPFLPNGDQEVKRVQGMNLERKQLQADSRERVGDTGLDNAALPATILADAVMLPRTLAAAGMRSAMAPRSLLDLAKVGGASGGVGAVLSPTEGSEEMSGGELAVEKATQGLVGTGIGAVASPLIGLGLGKLGQLANSAVESGGRMLRNLTGRNPALSTATDPRELEKFLEAQAASANVDWRAVPDALKESLREATRRATSVSGTLPEAAVKNRLIAESQGLPQLTLGQSTRDPVQFSREANSPEETLRNLFADQRNAATARLGKLSGDFGPPRTPFEFGTQIAEEVGGQAETRRKAVGALYDAFKSDAAGYHKLTNTPDFVKAALAELKVNQQFNDLPKTFRDQLMELSRGQNLSIRDAAQLWKNINSYYNSTYGTPAGAAVATLKTQVANLLDDATFAGTKRGTEVIEKFRAANAERRLMGEWENSSAAIKELAKKNPQVAAERVFERYVFSGSVKDFQGLWKTLPKDAQMAVRRQFVDKLSSMTLNQWGSSATRGGDAMKTLSGFPKEKLEVMFPGKELTSLKNTLEYLRLTTDAPPGNFVNRSNSLVDLKDFLGQTSNFPILGPAVSGPLRKMMEQHEARLAADGFGLVAPPPPANVPRVVESVVRRVPGAASPNLAPAAQGVFNPPEE